MHGHHYDLDGRVVTEIIDDDFIGKNPIVFATPDRQVTTMPGEIRGYSAEEQKEIEERLRGLGYLE